MNASTPARRRFRPVDAKDPNRIETCRNRFSVLVNTFERQTEKSAIVVLTFSEWRGTYCQQYRRCCAPHLFLFAVNDGSDFLFGVIGTSSHPPNHRSPFSFRPGLIVSMNSP